MKHALLLLLSFHSMNICKYKWYHKLDTQINIQNMIRPHGEVIIAIFLFLTFLIPGGFPATVTARFGQKIQIKSSA